MKPRLKPLNEQVIVITGASSGIGLATAEAAARAGARLVLVSRNETALAEIEHRLDHTGDRVMHMVADVGNREDVERVATEVIYRFGGFDTWINNAGVSVWGRLDQVSDDDHWRVMQTNFWGTFYGSTIALAHLRSKGGAIINIGSVESETPLPFHASYSASKHAIKALTDTMRVELEKVSAPVSVTLVRPTSTDTQFIDHSKNEHSSAPTLAPPAYAPETVADAILHAAQHWQRDVYIGNAKPPSELAGQVPRAFDWLKGKVTANWTPRRRHDDYPNGVPHRMTRQTWPGGSTAPSGHPDSLLPTVSLRVRQHPVATAALVAIGVMAAVTLLRRKH
ncbi:SDR family oxidoreductase [Pseudomonas matsuisoli]|uniref:Short-chain dehydrogenase/reductase n=1 Tax=Pseudomonas matsuisoli TaxID=1515666 RepID=A0A917PXZ2_9PSED|nr:SDR family oxidoreductase [Pseudomonas matsuisoli]GGJ99608.1 short-chain dehydrogenase/reductase [Pseudomonas matsuisoli]